MKKMTLAEFEAKCLNDNMGDITPNDVVMAISRVSELGEIYRSRLFAKADAWKKPPRPDRRTAGGIENGVPNGDRD